VPYLPVTQGPILGRLPLYVGADTLLTVLGVYDEEGKAYPQDATVTLSVYAWGSASPIIGPVTAEYDANGPSRGDYTAVVPRSSALVAGRRYLIEIVLSKGSFRKPMLFEARAEYYRGRPHHPHVFRPRGSPAPAGTASDPSNWTDRSPIATYGFSDPSYRTTTNPRSWNPSIFPGFTTDWPLAQQQSFWRDSAVANTAQCLARALAWPSRAQALISWDGWTGQEYNHPVSYVGDPRYRPAEVTEPAVADCCALIAAAGLMPGTIIRPTEYSATPPGSQTYGSSSLETLRQKVIYGRTLGFRLFYCDSSVFGVPGADFLDFSQPARLFTHAEAAALAGEFGDCLFVFEITDPTYDDIPNLQALKYPTGYLLGPNLSPERDFHGVRWTDLAEDPGDPATLALVGDTYARGAIPLITALSDLFQARSLAWSQLWLDRYGG
jgi:hypothetical protein